MCWAILLQAGAAVLGAYSSVQSANATRTANEYNAQIMERNAEAVELERKDVADAAAIERRRLGERVRAERGELFAKYGHMGLDAEFGSPADLIGDLHRAYTIDRDIIGRNEINSLRQLDKQEADYRSNAQLLRMGGKAAATAGTLNAAGSLLGGAATVADHWIQPSTGNAVGYGQQATPLYAGPTKLKIGGG